MGVGGVCDVTYNELAVLRGHSPHLTVSCHVRWRLSKGIGTVFNRWLALNFKCGICKKNKKTHSSEIRHWTGIRLAHFRKRINKKDIYIYFGQL